MRRRERFETFFAHSGWRSSPIYTGPSSDRSSLLGNVSRLLLHHDRRTSARNVDFIITVPCVYPQRRIGIWTNLTWYPGRQDWSLQRHDSLLRSDMRYDPCRMDPGHFGRRSNRLRSLLWLQLRGSNQSDSCADCANLTYSRDWSANGAHICCWLNWGFDWQSYWWCSDRRKQWTLPLPATVRWMCMHRGNHPFLHHEG